jgi:hypothetical protein
MLWQIELAGAIPKKMLAFSGWLTYVLHMAKKKATDAIATIEQIERSIHVIRGQRVMLDADLATLYGVTTKRLNEQVRRNLERFSYRLLVSPYPRRSCDLEVAKCPQILGTEAGVRCRVYLPSKASPCYRACSTRPPRYA